MGHQSRSIVSIRNTPRLRQHLPDPAFRRCRLRWRRPPRTAPPAEHRRASISRLSRFAAGRLHQATLRRPKTTRAVQRQVPARRERGSGGDRDLGSQQLTCRPAPIMMAWSASGTARAPASIAAATYPPRQCRRPAKNAVCCVWPANHGAKILHRAASVGPWLQFGADAYLYLHIHEMIEMGLLGIAMSRYSGCWVA